MEKYMQDAVEGYCKGRKIKKKDFAEKIGVTPAKLSHWLAGRTRFSISTLEKIKALIEAE
ncbi:MAG: helix-turn-helix transcriptional regulator [Bacteroidaceae bacterium]|nr:helix-turn-helix transcriptional regulator [Bacteroidaceae bacterium]